ncbi:uncharacterized protein [Phaseolus vulgaris]|uniref:uncharacterized protein n=1 Tax=Phaseolus vulgaris TaxID=3885 RepID=UPI0035CB9C01
MANANPTPASSSNGNPTLMPLLEQPMNNFLYLHPSENPAASLVSPVLDSTNYHSWSRSFITALSAKNKVEFILGSHPCPQRDDPTFSSWTRCNNMVVFWLVHSVSIPIRQSIVWMDIAFDIWNDLKFRYSQGDLSRISDLQFEVISLNQGDMSVTEYFTKLRIIWDELENFRPNPVCTCLVKCSCSVISIINQRKCEDRAMQFLRGLNDQYKNICSHVLLMDPIPAISKKISLVLQQERQLSTVVPAPSLHSLNSSRTTTCNFCGKYGHTEAVCFRKVGFPSGDVKTSKFSSTRKNCTFCNRLGHTVDTCYKKHGFPPGYKSINRTSQANNMFTTNSSSESFSKEQDVKGIQLTSQQCQFLTNILRQQNLEDPAPHAQINQVGTFSTDKITNTEQSSTGQSHPREDWYS